MTNLPSTDLADAAAQSRIRDVNLRTMHFEKGYASGRFAHRPRAVLSVLLAVAFLLGIALPAPLARAAAQADAIRIVVNSADDAINTDGKCTLREAIIAANKDRASSGQPGECPAGSGADTIVLPAGTYTLTRADNGKEDSSSTGDLDISASVTISASGMVTVTTVDGFKDRLFHILDGDVLLLGLNILGGNSGEDGGAVLNNGSLTIVNSAIVGNQAADQGGGIYNNGSLSLTNVTLSGNRSRTDGGGLFSNGTTSLNNVTIAFNTADSDSNNSGDGGGLARGGGTISLANSIVAGNDDRNGSTKHLDCSGAISSKGYNLIQNATGCSIGGSATGNLLGIDPKLGVLQLNGGRTLNHALLDGSPAIDAGNPNAPGSGNNACAATDQRGIARPAGLRCDIGAYEVARPASPVIIRVIASASDTTVIGRISGPPNTTFIFTYYSTANCDPNAARTPLGTSTVTTDADGHTTFVATLPVAVPVGQFIVATATDPAGNVSGFSPCASAGPGNDSWVRAMSLALTGDVSLRQSAATSAVVSQYIDMRGQSRWFKFGVKPGNKLVITLSNLPANYDLTVYKDISQTLQSLADPQTTVDLQRLDAEFAPDAFSPDAFSPDAFSPDAYSPDAFSPDAFSPDAYSPDAYSPDAFSPDAYSPDAYSPDAYSPDAFSPDAYSPDIFSPDAYSSAQTRSLIAVSAFESTASEGIALNTWNNVGEYYVRVRGRNGAFSLTAPFTLRVQQFAGVCASVSPIGTPTSPGAIAGGYKTIVLTDLARMAGSATEKAALQTALNAFAARPEVQGIIVDVGADARVSAANVQADAKPECPYAKNLVADAIKKIVDGYRALNPLEYVVIVGNDGVIPFFRYPDQALLANETNYMPPVRDATSSQAALRLGYIVSQDRYGTKTDISLKDDAFPIPDLAVGRLVETAADATIMLNAYLTTPNGVMAAPVSSLVTGYDFLADAANMVKDELQAGIGVTPDTLIAPRTLSPQDPSAWTAEQLKAKLLASRHDMVFLSGHFSANSALAADYTTRLLTGDLLASPVDMVNAIVFSVGCHAGYNVVDAHDVPGVTREPDWAQAFARKGATLIAGTGYQYGDTDFIEYSERLYLEFARQLRAGAGPISVGKALMKAKQIYLADTPQMRAIHEKAVLIAALFGLPMLQVKMPGARYTPGANPSIVGSTTPFGTAPGSTLGLRYADVSLVPSLTARTVALKNVQDASSVNAVYLVGSDGVASAPAELVLPLETRNVSVPGFALRGVGFRGGSYSDALNILPLIGAATTEIRGVHAPFLSDVFYPVKLWNANYFDALATGGTTQLEVTPAHFKSNDPLSQVGTLRSYSNMQLRLYYSANTNAYAGGSTPALAAPPTIARVASTVNGSTVSFAVNTVGNPAAGIQEVWVTFTALNGPFAGQWQSVNLTQSSVDSTLWTGSLNLGSTAASDVRYFVQAVNGVGLVSLAANLGAYYIPGAEAQPNVPTSLALELPSPTGVYGTQAIVSAILSSNSAPVPGQRVNFGLGSQTRQATTDDNGRATVTLSLLGLPGMQELRVSFAGTPTYLASSTSAPFTILKQPTSLTLTPNPASGFAEASALMTATLTTSTGRRLGEKTVFFIISGGGGSTGGPHAEAVITDYAGRATLGNVPLPPGSYSVAVYFSGNVPLPSAALSLSDERYEPSSINGALTLLNRPPTAANDAYTTNEDTALSVPAPGVLANDTDKDGDTLSAVLVNGPTNGALALNANGSFVYTPTLNFSGNDSFTYKAVDAHGGESNIATVSLTVNEVNDPPVCTTVTPSVSDGSVVTLWPPNGALYPVTLSGGDDPENEPITVAITGIRQDEPTGSDADGFITGSSTAQIRAERAGNGDGRVYHILFRVTDSRSGACTGDARVGVVPHDQGGSLDAIDGGPIYDSTVPQ